MCNCMIETWRPDIVACDATLKTSEENYPTQSGYVSCSREQYHVDHHRACNPSQHSIAEWDYTAEDKAADATELMEEATAKIETAKKLLYAAAKEALER